MPNNQVDAELKRKYQIAFETMYANHDSSSFLMVRMDHLWHLNGDGTAAIVLSYILNQATKDNQLLRIRNHLWFKCPLAVMQRKLRMSKHKLPRAVATLRIAGLIETDNRGIPATMWVKISSKRLEDIKHAYLESLVQNEDDGDEEWE